MIWGFPKMQLGDRWAHLNRIIKLSKDGNGYIYFDNKNEDEINKLYKLWNLINTDVKLNIIYKQHVNIPQADGVVEFPFPYYQTKKQWVSDSKKEYDICFQIKTNQESAEWLPIKNFTQKNLDDFKSKIAKKYKIIELGADKNLPIEEEIDIMLKSKVFVGISSGLTHIAHSVGIPVFLKKFENDDDNVVDPEIGWVRFIENFHAGKHFSLFSSIDELIYKIELFHRCFPTNIDWKLCPIFQIGVSDRYVPTYNQIFARTNSI
jgi:hypothetical protein